jgi:ankyrin repeat protein
MISLKEIFLDYQSLPEYSGLQVKDVHCRSLFGDLPVHIAATRGAVDELSILVQNGADISEGGEHGYRPLHNAVEQGQFEAVQWLIDHGADRHSQNDDGCTPEDLAKLLGENEIANYLNSGKGTARG